MRLALLPLTLVLVGCASGLDSAVFVAAPPTTPESIRISRTQRPQCSYEEIGIVTWRPTHGWQKLQSGVDKMRAEAARLGGDAIVGFSIGERRGDETTVISGDGAAISITTGVDTETVISGSVVRFRDRGCRT